MCIVDDSVTAQSDLRLARCQVLISRPSHFRLVSGALSRTYLKVSVDLRRPGLGCDLHDGHLPIAAANVLGHNSRSVGWYRRRLLLCSSERGSHWNLRQATVGHSDNLFLNWVVRS